MTETTTKLVMGILVIIVGLVLLPVLTATLNPLTSENRFLCNGNVSGTGVYSAVCTLGGTFTDAPANGRTLTIGSPVEFNPDSANRPALSGSGLGFTVAATATAAAATAAQTGPVTWAPSVGTAAIALLRILPLVFTIGLVAGGICYFVSAARSCKS